MRISRARPTDLDALAPMSRALNEHEAIELDWPTHRAALARLLDDHALGAVFLIGDPDPIGYAMCTFSYDLEFNGREAWLTELWIEDSRRSRGAGAAAIELLVPELRALGVQAVHLQVRKDNPAARLYERAGFVASPRTVMTRRL